MKSDYQIYQLRCLSDQMFFIVILFPYRAMRKMIRFFAVFVSKAAENKCNKKEAFGLLFYCNASYTSPAIFIDGVSVFSQSAHFAGHAVPGFALMN